MRSPADKSKKGAGDSPRKTDDRPPMRKLAEWITTIISALIVLSLAGFLIYHAIKHDGEEVPVQLTPMIENTRQVEGAFVLPVKIRNRGRRTIQDFRGELTFTAADGQIQRREIELGYLGERAEEDVHVYLPGHPRELRIEVMPLSYRLE